MNTPFTIIINSAHREGQIFTADSFPFHWHKFVKILVPAKEWKGYRSRTNWNVKPLPKDMAECLPPQRHYAIKTCKTPYALIMDDDFDFFQRQEGKLKKVSSLTDSFLDEIETILKCEDVGAVGISPQQSNWQENRDIKPIGRLFGGYAVKTEIYRKLKINIDAPVKGFCTEDSLLTLHLLTNGFRTPILYTYARRELKISNAPGGCSAYRSLQSIKDSMEYVHSVFPYCTEVVDTIKSSKLWPGIPVSSDGMKHIPNIKVFTKRALEHSKHNVRRFFS